MMLAQALRKRRLLLDTEKRRANMSESRPQGNLCSEDAALVAETCRAFGKKMWCRES